MENENEKDVTEEETKEEETKETTDWEAEAKKWEGIAKRNKSDLEKANEKLKQPKDESPEKEQKNTNKLEELGYAERAYLKSEGVPEEDYDYLIQEAKGTGKELYDLLKYNYVKEELKKRKDARNLEESIPKGNRSSAPSRNSKEYFLTKIEKGEMTVLDIEDRKLRSEVLKARQELNKSKIKFTNQPIA